jgi:hypothetical protein
MIHDGKISSGATAAETAQQRSGTDRANVNGRIVYGAVALREKTNQTNLKYWDEGQIGKTYLAQSRRARQVRRNKKHFSLRLGVLAR